MGAQISGIKTEDFVSSNVSPAVTFCLGEWVSPEIALQVGFKGLYFHTISNDDKRYYNFIHSCGLKEYSNTSLYELGIKIDQNEFDENFKKIFLKKLKNI